MRYNSQFLEQFGVPKLSQYVECPAVDLFNNGFTRISGKKKLFPRVWYCMAILVWLSLLVCIRLVGDLKRISGENHDLIYESHQEVFLGFPKVNQFRVIEKKVVYSVKLIRFFQLDICRWKFCDCFHGMVPGHVKWWTIAFGACYTRVMGKCFWLHFICIHRKIWIDFWN